MAGISTGGNPNSNMGEEKLPVSNKTIEKIIQLQNDLNDTKQQLGIAEYNISILENQKNEKIEKAKKDEKLEADKLGGYVYALFMEVQNRDKLLQSLQSIHISINNTYQELVNKFGEGYLSLKDKVFIKTQKKITKE